MNGPQGRRENLYLRQIPLCPTFEPTLEEFTEISFEDYLIECEKLLPPTCGVYKVSHHILNDKFITCISLKIEVSNLIISA